MLQDSQIIQKLSKTRAICLCSQCSAKFTCNIYTARKSKPGHLCGGCKNRLRNVTVVDQKTLLELFVYNEMTGELRHKLDTLRSFKGDLATYAHSQGYLSVALGTKEYLAHRVIWMMKTGCWPEQVDHADHDRSNNRWNNLTEVVSRENQLNMSLKKNNSSGATGVRILPSGRYCAYIMVHRKQLPLGTYDDFDDAVAARKAAELRYNFHVNHGS